MATSGTVYTNYARSSRLYVNWKIVRQDVANNKTLIAYDGGIDNGNYWHLNAIKINSVYIGDDTNLYSGTFSNVTASGKSQRFSGQKWVSHNDDGTRNIKVSINGWFYESGNVSGSNTFTLTKIDRYPSKPTTVTLAALDVMYGDTIGFGDVMVIGFGGASGVITGYDIERRSGGGEWESVESISTSDKSGTTMDTLTVSNLDINGAGSEIVYRVRAKNGSLPSDWVTSNALKITGAMKLKANGNWENGTAWIKANGEWKRAKRVWIKVNGIWKVA